MKKIITCLMLAGAMGAQAQIARFSGKSALEEIAADKFLAAGNMTDYDRLPRPAALTPAPKGYEVYYLSHYGRHGARYLLEENDYAMPVKTLRQAKFAGKLTPLGDKVLAKLDSMQKTTKDRLGDLTAAGQRQHHGIGKRMAQNFPELFKTPNLPIHSVATTSIRAILSMMAECEELQAANPSARIYNDASKADMNYMNHQQQRGPGAGMPNMKIMSAMQKQSAMSDSLKHPERLMQQLFNDQHWVYLNVTTGQLMSKIADIALNMQSHDGDAELLELFSPQELHDLWISNNLYWYLMYSNAPQTDGKQPWNQKYLLQNIIETADTVTKPQVSLRFGHDTVVLPLLCMMDIDGSAVQVDDLNELENSFRSYHLIPTGCNVQLVFYRPKKNKDGEKLVKVLFNERESHLPIATDTWPYYKWKDVREYYLNKLAEHK